MAKSQQKMKHAREKYSLRPHEKRELVKLASPSADRRKIQLLSTRFQVSLKVVHEVLSHHKIPIHIENPLSKPEPSPAQCNSRPKLTLQLQAKNRPEQKTETPAKAEEISVITAPADTEASEKLVADRLALEKRIRDLETRERELLRRESILEQDLYDVEIALKQTEDMISPEEYGRIVSQKDNEINDLKDRIKVLAGECRQKNAEPFRLISYGMAQQMVLSAKIELVSENRMLQSRIDFLESAQKQEIPVLQTELSDGPMSMMVL